MIGFDNTVKVEWCDKDPRNMILLEDLSFTDKKGFKWDTSTGDVINGASIPKFFWRIIGSPFVGKYRRPSVVHDVHCDKKIFPHKMVHHMFYEAMIYDGVHKFKAKAMYRAVSWFGPKW